MTPGLSQLGSVWLPLPHVLLIPLVAVRALWQNGFAGAIVGGACFVYASTRVFALVFELTKSNLAAWCGFAAFVVNLNLLYLQTTALTEPVLLAFFVGAVYHFARWTRTRWLSDLFWSALLTCATTLSRYDGWFFLAVAVAVVWLVSRRIERRPHATEANVVLFAVVGGSGVVMWLLYNLLIFGDPLYFVHSRFSAQSQQKTLAGVGMLVTKGDPVESMLTWGWTIFRVCGPALTVVGLAAAVTVVSIRSAARFRYVATLALLGSPIVFNFISLTTGQSSIRIPDRPPFGVWNVRFGVIALPFFAVACGILCARWRRAVPVVGVAVCLGVVAMVASTPLTLADGRYGYGSAAVGRPELAAEYLSRHYGSGRVLVDDAFASPFMFATGLDLREFVTAGEHPYYERALEDPASKVEWLGVYYGDEIDTEMRRHDDRYKAFEEVFEYGRVRLFRRVS
jgi:hypothetical protein